MFERKKPRIDVKKSGIPVKTALPHIFIYFIIVVKNMYSWKIKAPVKKKNHFTCEIHIISKLIIKRYSVIDLNKYNTFISFFFL